MIALKWVDTNSNTADPFIKPLSQAKSQVHFENIGLRNFKNKWEIDLSLLFWFHT